MAIIVINNYQSQIKFFKGMAWTNGCAREIKFVLRVAVVYARSRLKKGFGNSSHLQSRTSMRVSKMLKVIWKFFNQFLWNREFSNYGFG